MKQLTKRTIILIVLVIFLLFVLSLSGGIDNLAIFIDAPSLLLILVPLTCLLILSGQISDLFRGFSFLMLESDITNKELRSSENTFTYAIKVVFLTAGFGMIVGVVSMLSHLDDPSMIGPSLAIVLLTLFYAIIINLFLYTILSKIRKERIYRK